MSGTVGIFGLGKLGTALARLAIAGGHRVLVVGSPRQHALDLVVSVLVPGAEVTDAESLVAASDVIVLAVPFGKADQVPWHLLSGRVVVDAMNYWAPVDGRLGAVETDARSTSEQVAAHNPDVRVVKGLNQVSYHALESAAGAVPPRAVALASDDLDAVRTVSAFVASLGFDPVHVGPLAAGRQLEPGQPLFGAELTASELRAQLV